MAGVPLIERIKSHCDKKQDQFNEAFVKLYDEVQLNERNCDELLFLLNEKLPGEMNPIASKLRRVLCLSIDMIKAEDALVSINEAKQTQGVD
jgi:hypothetical protein